MHARPMPLSRAWARPGGRAVRWSLATAGGIVAGVLLILLAVAPAVTDRSYWARIVAWRGAEFDDFNRFPFRVIPNRAPVFRLAPAAAELPAAFATVTASRDSAGAEGLDAFLARTGSRELLVLRDDTLVVERHANGSAHDATQTSFSMAKSFDSTLVGIAIADGAIHSLEDPIVRYLPELAGGGLEAVTIRDLLGMDSGLRYSGAGSGGMPWQDDARTYYDPNLRRLALSVQAAVPPATRWEYNNYHPLLVGLILERVSGQSVSAYLSEKLWQPLGMEAPASWSLDSTGDGFEKMESGINARAADFARFGRLMLKQGWWNGQAVVPSAWVEQATRPNAPQLKNDYGLFWWLDSERPGRFYAWGNLGQFIYVAPDRDAVVVRMGASYGGLDHSAWVSVLQQLADRMDPATSG